MWKIRERRIRNDRSKKRDDAETQLSAERARQVIEGIQHQEGSTNPMTWSKYAILEALDAAIQRHQYLRTTNPLPSSVQDESKLLFAIFRRAKELGVP